MTTELLERETTAPRRQRYVRHLWPVRWWEMALPRRWWRIREGDRALCGVVARSAGRTAPVRETPDVCVVCLDLLHRRGG